MSNDPAPTVENCNVADPIADGSAGLSSRPFDIADIGSCPQDEAETDAIYAGRIAEDSAVMSAVKIFAEYESTFSALRTYREMAKLTAPMTASQQAAADCAKFVSQMTMPDYAEHASTARASAAAALTTVDSARRIAAQCDAAFHSSRIQIDHCLDTRRPMSTVWDQLRKTSEACSAWHACKSMALDPVPHLANPAIASMLLETKRLSDLVLPLPRKATCFGRAEWYKACKLVPPPCGGATAASGSAAETVALAIEGAKKAHLPNSAFAEREGSWSKFLSAAQVGNEPEVFGFQTKMGPSRTWSIYYLNQFLGHQVRADNATRSALGVPTVPPLKTFGMIQRAGLDLRSTERLLDNVLSRVRKLVDRSAEEVEEIVRDIFERVALVIGQYRLIRGDARPAGRSAHELIRTFDIHTGVSPPPALDRQAPRGASINQVPGVCYNGYSRPAPRAHLHHRRLRRSADSGRPARQSSASSVECGRLLVRYRRRHQGGASEGRALRGAGSWPLGDQFRLGRRA